MEAYKDNTLPLEDRLQDLLSRMTLEEKLGQMVQLPAKKGIVEENFVNKLEEWHIGSFLHCTGDQAEKIQKRAAETRLGIPVIFGIDAIHGHCFEDRATVFPTQLGLSCSWNPDLIKEAARITAQEVRATGLHWTFSPVLCVARDPRWGRVDETFGEDPWLNGELAGSMIQGYQGENAFTEDSILACAKHYVGYGESIGGRDSYESDISRRNLLQNFLPPFERAVKQYKTATLMTGYQAINGIPATSNRWLLQETAKDNWKLEGFIVTDWNNVGALVERQKVAEDMKEAARQAIEAGNDMMMSTPGFFEAALDLVREGIITEDRIEESAARILRLKFSLGLFDDHRYSSSEKRSRIGAPGHWDLSLETSLQSLVLLKNENALPLKDPKGMKILLVGPNADDIVAQLGDWSFGSMQAGATNESFHREDTVTLKQGLESAAEDLGFRLDYIRGAHCMDPEYDEIDEVREKAGRADCIIACVGDTILQHGEGHDRADLNLTGRQQELLEAVKESGKKLIVVLMASKPLVIPWIKENAHALICAFNPGPKGGKALAKLIFGEWNPSGKLTISFPYSTGQLPVHYKSYEGWHCDNPEGEERYIDQPAAPLFSFGEGLSYSSFQYSGLEISPDSLRHSEPVRVSAMLKNNSDREGTEIVQLYINDRISSVTTPSMELRGFRRVTLGPGEEQKVNFTLVPEDLSLIDADLQAVVEPGEFEVYLGGSSKKSQCLKGVFSIQ